MSGAEGSCCGEYFPAGPNQQPVLRDYFQCRGDEDSLSECPLAVGGDCDHIQDVSVICSYVRTHLAIIANTMNILLSQPQQIMNSFAWEITQQMKLRQNSSSVMGI